MCNGFQTLRLVLLDFLVSFRIFLSATLANLLVFLSALGDPAAIELTFDSLTTGFAFAAVFVLTALVWPVFDLVFLSATTSSLI